MNEQERIDPTPEEVSPAEQPVVEPAAAEAPSAESSSHAEPATSTERTPALKSGTAYAGSASFPAACAT